MYNFTFLNPTKVMFGKDTIYNIGSEIKKNNIKKILMIYGEKSIKKNGIYEKVIKSLKDNDIEYYDGPGVQCNPVLSKVHRLIELGKEKNIEGVLAVGGGSVIDTAKAVAAGICYTGDIWDAFEFKYKIENSLPIFTVLTISATGSEMNGAFVITNEEENKKESSGSLAVFPKLSIIDPTLQKYLSKKQTACGAVDSISHILEYYFISKGNNDIIDGMAESVIKTIIKHTRILLKDSTNYNSRCQLAWAATLALNGSFRNGNGLGDWSTHEMAHCLSAYNNLPHGVSIALIQPLWMKHVFKNNIKQFKKFANNIFNVYEKTNEKTALRGIEKLQEFYSEIGIYDNIEKIDYKTINNIKKDLNEKLPIGVVKELNKEDIEKIISYLY